jgi:hypothetical protein
MRLCGLLLFFATLSFSSSVAVKQDQAVLRSGCETRDEAVASMPAGNPVEIRFAVAGGADTCYKVSTTVGGKPMEGYLPASALSGLEEFVTARQNAPALDFSRAMTSKVDAISSMIGSASGSNPLARASHGRLWRWRRMR